MKPIQHTIATPYMVGPVHCYTALCDDELVLFDTGPPTDIARRYLREHIDLARLKHICITHCHIDHYGLLSWLEQESDATIYLPYRDVLKIKGHQRRMPGISAILEENGFERTFLDGLEKILASGVLFPPFPDNYLIAEEALPDRLGITVLACPGHSQSDLVYVLGDYAVTGDTLLQGIFQSPLLDVDLVTNQRFNNYQAYCQSIVRLAGLAGKTVLPGHRRAITAIGDCLHFYVAKLLQRVESFLPCRGEADVAAIIRRLFDKELRDPFHIYLKASEILFIQDFLADPAPLAAALQTIGLYPAVAEQFERVRA